MEYMKRWLEKLIIFSCALILLLQVSCADSNNSSNYIDNSLRLQELNTTIPESSSLQQVIIQVNDTDNIPVKEATIKVFLNGSMLYSLFTFENGTAFFQAEQNKTYTFIIEEESYVSVTRNITILPGFPENNIKFTLRPLRNQKDSDFMLIFIPAAVGFVVFIFWSIRFYRNSFFSIVLENTIWDVLLIILLLSWPLILLYLLYTNKENILLGELRFPVFIPIAALIGVLSYLLLSIQEIFVQVIPKYKKKSIVWGYVRRITVAPYIAILGVYILLDAAKIQNQWFILLFSFFAGMFTKTIEEWLYRSIQGLLPEDLRKGIREREKYNTENSELVMILHVEEDVAYELYKNYIETVEQLAIMKPDISALRNREGINQEYLSLIIEKAKKYLFEINKMKELLNLTDHELDLLVDTAGVYSIKDFAFLDIDLVECGSENVRIKQSMAKKQIKAREIAGSKTLKLLSIEDIEKLRDISKDTIEYFELLKLHADIRSTGISGWTVEATRKLLEAFPDLTLKDLKNLSTTEEGKKAIFEKMKELPKMSELLDLMKMMDI